MSRSEPTKTNCARQSSWGDGAQRPCASSSLPHEVNDLARNTCVRRIDRIHFGHMTMLGQHDRAQTSARALAALFLQEFELLDEPRKVEFGCHYHQRYLGGQQT